MACLSDCPRCGRACTVGAHNSAHCSACFTSFRADDPAACLPPAQLVVSVDETGETTLEPDAQGSEPTSVYTQDALFAPAVAPMPGQTSLDVE